MYCHFFYTLYHCPNFGEHYKEWVKAIQSKKKAIENKFNKKYGVYYTPREIVHYMCRESLIQYLTTEMKEKVNKENIEYFIKHGEEFLECEHQVEEKGKETKTYYHNEFLVPIKENAEIIDEKLKSIRVCDPAIGSGAFPVNMMNEIVKARNVLTTYIKDKTGRSIYNFKRHTIENSIYGVDIDIGAIEIAKLRFWLSLVVDEQDIHKIKPLPNLSYKIMQGNSLLEEFEGIKLFNDKLLNLKEDINKKRKQELKHKLSKVNSKIILFYQKDPKFMKYKKINRPIELYQLEKEQQQVQNELYSLNKQTKENLGIDINFTDITSASNLGEQLKEMHKDFLNSYERDKKQDKLKEIQKIEWELIKATLKEKGKQNLLPKIDKFRDANFHPYFLWKLHFTEVFKEKGGFDIVIGNPPYISYYSRQAQKTSSDYINAFKSEYDFILDKKKKGRFHSVMFFLEKSLKMLNKNAINIFIIDISFFELPFKDIRKYLLEKSKIIEIVKDLNEFEKVASGQLILSFKNTILDNYNINIKNGLMDNAKIISKNEIIKTDNYTINIINPFIKLINQKVERIGNALENYTNVKVGVNVGGVRSYFIKTDTKYHKFINGGDNVKKYLLEFPSTKQRRTGEMYFDFNKQVEKYIWRNNIGTPSIGESNQRFLSPKLIIRQSDTQITATYDKDGYHCDYNLFTVNKLDNDISIKFILAILNSSLINFYCITNSIIKIKPGKTPQIRVADIKTLPIVETPIDKQKPFVKLVDQILIDKKAGKDTQHLEDKIDLMVYKLYELSYDEVKIVDSEFNNLMNREDYEKFNSFNLETTSFISIAPPLLI